MEDATIHIDHPIDESTHQECTIVHCSQKTLGGVLGLGGNLSLILGKFLCSFRLFKDERIYLGI